MMELLSKIAETGIAGAIAAICLWYAWKMQLKVDLVRSEKDQLYERMIKMGIEQNDKYHLALGELNSTIRIIADTEE